MEAAGRISAKLFKLFLLGRGGKEVLSKPPTKFLISMYLCRLPFPNAELCRNCVGTWFMTGNIYLLFFYILSDCQWLGANHWLAKCCYMYWQLVWKRKVSDTKSTALECRSIHSACDIIISI